MASDSQAIYAPSADPTTGYLLFVRETTLMAQPFDTRALKLSGEPVPVAEQILSSYGAGATFHATEAGLMVYASGSSNTELG